MGKVAMKIDRATGASLSGTLSGAPKTQEELRDSQLLEVDELSEKLARETGRVLILAAGQKPAILERARYFKDTHFDGLWDP
jgi:type IV secretory pathway TraG/TraD family ATPase VirD4